MRSYWLRIALLNLLLAAAIGALLRFAFVEEITWLDYRKWMHAHSHVAMLGWIYLALYAFFIDSFLDPEKARRPFYRQLFWATQATVVGMLITFPIYGYASWSIVFSTLHVLLSYGFAYRFWRDLDGTGPAVWFARSSLVFMVLSTLALWGMVPIMLLDQRGSAFYYMTVQFFLHFQFNGWYLMGVLALLFQLLQRKNIPLPPSRMRWFWGLLVVATFLTYALAVAWSNPLPAIFFVNSTGVLTQLAALLIFISIVRGIWPDFSKTLHRWPQMLLLLAFLAFGLKVLAQTAVVVPYVAEVAYTIRNFVIGFVHLLMLGIFSSFLLGYGLHTQLLTDKPVLFRLGAMFFLTGIIGSEALLFLQGLLFWSAKGFLPSYYEWLFGFSLLLPMGIVLMLAGQLRKGGQFY